LKNNKPKTKHYNLIFLSFCFTKAFLLSDNKPTALTKTYTSLYFQSE